MEPLSQETIEQEATVIFEQAKKHSGSIEALSTSVEVDCSKVFRKGFAITTLDQFYESGNLLKQIQKRSRELETTRLAITRPMREAKARVDALFAPIEQTLARATAIIKTQYLAWQELEKKRNEEAQRLARLKIEQERKAEAERLEAAAMAALANSQPKAAEAAFKAMEKIESAPIPAAPAPFAAASLKGISTATTWKGEVIDPALVPREFLMVNQRAIDAYAKAAKENAKTPGVRYYAEKNVRAGAAK